MRWFKHLCTAHRNQRLCKLRDSHGWAGYGMYFAVQEMIGEQVSGEKRRVFCEFSEKNWRIYLNLTPKKQRVFFERCHELGLFEVTFTEKLIRVESPKLLKYIDEHTRKTAKNSGVNLNPAPDPTPEQRQPPTPEQELELEVELESENTTTTQPHGDGNTSAANPKKAGGGDFQDFDRLLAMYPKTRAGNVEICEAAWQQINLPCRLRILNDAARRLGRKEPGFWFAQWAKDQHKYVPGLLNYLRDADMKYWRGTPPELTHLSDLRHANGEPYTGDEIDQLAGLIDENGNYINSKEATA